MPASATTISRPDLRKTAIVLILTGWIMGLLDWLRPESAALDVDDRLRRLQIEDLLSDGRWYDLRLPRVSLPDGVIYESHWSRLVDLPYWSLTRVLDLFMTTEQALHVASFLIPPLLFILFVWLTVTTVRDLLGRNPNLLQLMALVALLSQIAYEFVPLRIDHHNMQCLCLAGIARGLSLKTPLKAGLLIGMAAALSITIGLETAPVLFVLIAGLALTAVASQSAALRLTGFGASLSVTTLASALIFLGPTAMFSTACDAFSGTFVLAMTIGGAVLALLPLVWGHPLFSGQTGPAKRFVSLAICGGALALICAWLFPECLAGPTI